MPKILVLPDVLAHKIAAGEIVERPASVVKELVENSIDAQATSISIAVEAGGTRSIVVRDNGVGMSREDAELAFLHHATSKICNIEDLDQIRTLGFRGEALPSIASVSRLRARTVEVPPGNDSAKGSSFQEPVPGTEILIEGGRQLEIQEISWPRGTEICVQDLFFNVPARRKFLKTVTTEMSHVSRQLAQYALAYPEVEFLLTHEGRSVLEAPSVSSLQDRIYQVLGGSFLENLVQLEYEAGGVRVTGFASLPHEQRNSPRSQYLYVNRRVVRDKVLTHAIRLAYRDLIPATSYPVIIVFIGLDPSRVDVNVHPTKTEIRFRDSDVVHRAIYHAIEEALAREMQGGLSALARNIPDGQLRTSPGSYARNSTLRAIEHFFQRSPDSSMGFPELRQTAAAGASTPYLQPPGAVTNQIDRSDPHRFEIPETAYLSPIPVVLGQFVESFVVAADREGVMLIDQHVAHERILYDQALKRMTSGQKPATQRLLAPLTVDLSAEQTAQMQELLDQLNSSGFEVDWFGPRTVVVKGVPDLAPRIDDIPQILEGILESIGHPSSLATDEGSLLRVREKIAISLSCRSAIKINTPLSQEKMQWLIDGLFQCENPFTCPHGRPIVLRLGIEDILRGFKRI